MVYFKLFSETVNTPEKKVADSPVKDKKVPDSPAKKVESPIKEKAAENGSAKTEEEDDEEVKENGASEEEEEDVEKEQNGDSKGLFCLTMCLSRTYALFLYLFQKRKILTVYKRVSRGNLVHQKLQ